MSIYTSQGTIRCEIRNNSTKTTTIFFVPEPDYSIKYRTKDYAVFVPQLRNCNSAIVMEYSKDKEIVIGAAISDCTDVIFSAAAHQTKVEILVNVEKPKMSALLDAEEEAEKAAEAAKKAEEAAAGLKECLKLVGITVPAK